MPRMMQHQNLIWSGYDIVGRGYDIVGIRIIRIMFSIPFIKAFWVSRVVLSDTYVAMTQVRTMITSEIPDM